MPLTAYSDGKKLTAPLMDAAGFGALMRLRLPVSAGTDGRGYLAYPAEAVGLRFFKVDKSMAAFAGKECLDSLRMAAAAIEAARELGWEVEAETDIGGVDAGCIVTSPSGKYIAVIADKAASSLESDAAKIAEAGAVPVLLVGPKASAKSAPRVIPVSVSGGACSVGSEPLKGVLKGVFREIDGQAAVAAVDPVAPEVATLNYFAAVESLTPVQADLAAKCPLRSFEVRPLGIADWSAAKPPQPEHADAGAEPEEEEATETLNLVHIGMHSEASAIRAVEKLLGVAPEPEEDDGYDGSAGDAACCSLASFVADANGIAIPGSFRLSTYAGSLATMADGGVPVPAKLASALAEAQQSFDTLFGGRPVSVKAISEFVASKIPASPASVHAPARAVQFRIKSRQSGGSTRSEMEAALADIMAEPAAMFRKPEPAEDPAAEAQRQAERLSAIDQAVPRLGTFFLEDIVAAAELMAGQLDGSPLKPFLSPEPLPANRRTDAESLVAIRRAAASLLAKWPGGAGAGGLELVWRQRMAVAEAVSQPDGSVAALSGPPGTGKSAAIREMLAGMIVQRARSMAAFDDPLDAFSRRCGHWEIDPDVSSPIVVACANNGAVENIVRELGSLGHLGGPWAGGQGLSYLEPIADRAMNAGVPPESRKKAWGLPAAVLGRQSNVEAFRKAALRAPELLQDVEIVQMFPAEAVREGPHKGQPRVMALCWHGHRKIYLEFTGDELAGLANGMRSNLPATVTARASERAIKSRVADARFDVISLNPGGADRWLRDILLDGNDSETAMAGWRAARAAFLETAAKLEALPPPAPAPEETMDAEEMARFRSDVGAGHRVSPERLAAALAFSPKTAGDQTPVELAVIGDAEADRLAEEMFARSFDLRLAFIRRAARPMLESLSHWLDAGLEPGSGQRLNAWRAFFLAVPVCSATLASMAKLFAGMGPGSIGDLIIDEAGQASPHAAVGGLARCKRAVIVGDRLQVEPVSLIPDRISRLLAKHCGIPSGDFLIGDRTGVSAQSVADRVSRLGAPTADGWTGCPLRVNRRNSEHALAISNAIAYGGAIVHAARATPGIGVGACPGTWIDTADETGGWLHSMPEQERIVHDMILQAEIDGADADGSGLPDWFIVSPFKAVVASMREEMIKRSGILAAASGDRATAKAVAEWAESRIGTIHTIQGREAQVVLVVLGGGTGRPRAVAWAGRRPNLLNVAASRAKRSVHFIGNRALWVRKGGVFSVLAEGSEVGKLYPTVSVPDGHSLDFSGTPWRPVRVAPEKPPEIKPIAARPQSPPAKAPGWPGFGKGFGIRRPASANA